MWESLARVNAVVGGVVGGPVGLALLFGTGCLLTVRTGFFQLRYFGYWMRHTIGAIFLDPVSYTHLRGGPDRRALLRQLCVQPDPCHRHGQGGLRRAGL